MVKPLAKNGEIETACLNGWSTIPCAYAAELLAQGGFGSVTLDMQHGAHDFASVLACLQALNAYDITPLVRVPWNEPGILGKVLDAGAWGVICPMVNTAEEAAALTGACLYPPSGRRSNGPFRASVYGGVSRYQDMANAAVSILPQIETVQAVENIDSILDTPGVSGIYVGPSDLGLSLGLKGTMDREEPEVLAIYGTLIEATRRRGLIAGIHTAAPSYARRMIDMGFRLVTVASDAGLLIQGGKTVLNTLRSGPPATGR